jgi:hypothetical protein
MRITTLSAATKLKKKKKEKSEGQGARGLGRVQKGKMVGGGRIT